MKDEYKRAKDFLAWQKFQSELIISLKFAWTCRRLVSEKSCSNGMWLYDDKFLHKTNEISWSAISKQGIICVYHSNVDKVIAFQQVYCKQARILAFREMVKIKLKERLHPLPTLHTYFVTPDSSEAHKNNSISESCTRGLAFLIKKKLNSVFSSLIDQ